MPVRDAGPRVAVVGGGLSGMAAAARLAKMGHAVTLYEAHDRLGGTWAAYEADVAGSARLVDDVPAVLGFPAPWRDLFRKSGRPLEAELARGGYALVPAAAAAYELADGGRLVLPSDRGDQHDTLTRAYGPDVATRWRDLLDGLDDVWQALRGLGVETVRQQDALTRDVRRRLWSRRSLADLAERAGHPHLRAVVRSVAHRQGSTPERTPALAAVDLAVARTFGRWQVEPTASAPGDAGRSSVLAAALATRLDLRRVTVLTRTTVTAVRAQNGWSVVSGEDSTEPYAAVVLAVDPWTAGRLCPPVGRALRGRLRFRGPAAAPTVDHHLEQGSAAVGETVTLDADGVPVVRYRRPVIDGTVVSVHDFRRTRTRPAYGLAARGFRGWARSPDTLTGPDGVVLAGPAQPAGPGASSVVLSGALAAYAVAGRRD